MGQRLLVGLGAVTLVLMTVLASHSFVPAAGSDVAGPSPALVAPVSGGCLPGTQQCSPVVPRETGGATPTIVLVATLVTMALVGVGLARPSRGRRATRLPTGVAVRLLHPPRAGLGTV